METINLPNFYNHNVTVKPNEFLFLTQCGREVSAPRFARPQFTNSYIITVVKSGKGTFESRGSFYKVSKHDALLTHPNELTILTADAKNPLELCFFAFSGKLLTSLPPRKGSIIITGRPFDDAYLSPFFPAWEFSSK